MIDRTQALALISLLRARDQFARHRTDSETEMEVRLWMFDLNEADVDYAFARQQINDHYLQADYPRTPITSGMVTARWLDDLQALPPPPPPTNVPPWDQPRTDGWQKPGDPAYADPEVRDWAIAKIRVAMATTAGKPLPNGGPPLDDPYWTEPPVPTFHTPILQPDDRFERRCGFLAHCRCTHRECSTGILDESGLWCPTCWDGRNAFRLAKGKDPVLIGHIGPRV
jgi:hypothetical protein